MIPKTNSLPLLIYGKDPEALMAASGSLLAKTQESEYDKHETR